MRGSAAFRVAVAPGGALAGPWVQNSLWTAARAVPSLDLRFADNKSLVDATTGASLVTFTRASSGTFVGSDGVLQTAATDVPRFDHNPTTGESLGLLVEEARTNLLLQSNQFDTTWANTNSSETAASGTAPDGTNTAWELKDTLDVISSTHQVTQTITFTSGITYTFTCWMKAGTLTQGGFVLPTAAFTSGINCRINLLTGSVLSSSATLAASTTLFPNGWVRVTAVATATATAGGSAAIRIMDGAISYIGTGNGTVLIWGAQLEAGAFPTSYIPTTTATVTRAADVASISGSNFSSWYRADEGTVFADGSTPAFTQTTGFVAINAGGSTNRLDIRQSRSLPTVNGAATGVAWTQVIAPPTLVANTLYKQATAVSNASHGNSINGALDTSSTTIGTIAATQLIFGMRDSQTAPTGGSVSTIKRLAFWPTRLANTTLQAITQP